MPLWVNIENSSMNSVHSKDAQKNGTACDHECLINGLLYAQVLGSAARKGFDVVFFEENFEKSALATSTDMKKAVTILHKRLMGSKVFNVRVTKSSLDGKMSTLFSHCSKKSDGSITLMGINFSNMRSKFNIKISSNIDSTSTILQYMLSASDGHVLLNNEKFNAFSAPSIKYKKLSKHAISLMLPPFSMAFWTVKNVKAEECLSLKDALEYNSPKAQMTSTDKLLKKLVASEFNGKRSNVIEKARFKRQLGDGISGQYLPSTFDIDLTSLQPLKLPSLMLTSSSNHKPIGDVFFSRTSDVFKATPASVNPPQPEQNPSLPTGDVYMKIDDGIPATDGELKVVVGDEPKKRRESRKKSSNKIVYKETTEEAPEYVYSNDYLETFVKASKPKKSSRKAEKEQPQEIGELFEAEQPDYPTDRFDDQMRSPSHNVELKTVIRELEPTYRQSKTALKAAKKKWNRQQVMELLENAELNEEEKSKLAEAEDFEVIDLTDNGDVPNYEEYEEDDDGFFDNDKVQHVRQKRELNDAKNEIPKYGFHEMIYDEEEDSIENLMDDVHLYMSPHNTRDRETTTNAPISSTNNPPITVKAINFFSKSLNHAIDLLDSTLVGWWDVFNPKESVTE